MATSNRGTQKIAQLIVVSEQVGRYMLCGVLLLILASSVFAAPTVTVTASAQSILGTTQTVSMTLTLIDPGQTGMLKAGSVVVTNFTATSAIGTTVSVGPIYGADVIADGFGNLNQVYYKVQVFPVIGGIIASTPALQNFYAFIGSGTIDVSSATPLSPSFQTGTSGNVVLPGNLTVNGTINSTGTLTAASPVINGTPTGTGIPTLTLKKGTGNGTDYTGSNTSNANLDGTNLSYTVTIPTGWKLSVQASGSIGVSTAAVAVVAALSDGGVTLVEVQGLPSAAGSAGALPFALSWIINGDGASHTLTMQARTTNAADAWLVKNSSATNLPTMTFLLCPSN